jgi:hypothetical protein
LAEVKGEQQQAAAIMQLVPPIAVPPQLSAEDRAGRTDLRTIEDVEAVMRQVYQRSRSFELFGRGVIDFAYRPLAIALVDHTVAEVFDRILESLQDPASVPSAELTALVRAVDDFPFVAPDTSEYFGEQSPVDHCVAVVNLAFAPLVFGNLVDDAQRGPLRVFESKGGADWRASELGAVAMDSLTAFRRAPQFQLMRELVDDVWVERGTADLFETDMPQDRQKDFTRRAEALRKDVSERELSPQDETRLWSQVLHVNATEARNRHDVEQMQRIHDEMSQRWQVVFGDTDLEVVNAAASEVAEVAGDGEVRKLEATLELMQQRPERSYPDFG